MTGPTQSDWRPMPHGAGLEDSPQFSYQADTLGENGGFGEHIGEFLDQWAQTRLWHGGHEVAEHAALRPTHGATRPESSYGLSVTHMLLHGFIVLHHRLVAVGAAECHAEGRQHHRPEKKFHPCSPVLAGAHAPTINSPFAASGPALAAAPGIASSETDGTPRDRPA